MKNKKMSNKCLIITALALIPTVLLLVNHQVKKKVVKASEVLANSVLNQTDKDNEQEGTKWNEII